MKTPTLTLTRVNELIDYNPTTGELTWKVQQGKSKKGSNVGSVQAGYRKTTIDKEQIKVHRLCWFIVYGTWPEGQIDHIDGDKLNNKISNLRDVSMSVNMQNRYSIKRKNNDLPYGVTITPYGKYVANIRVGVFKTKEEASEAFMAAKRLIHEGCTR